MKCRFCDNPLTHVFADLNDSPPSNSYLKKSQLSSSEARYPLKVWTCEKCFLAQLDEFKSHNEIFSEDYAYFSSFSTSWVAHAKNYVEKMAKRFGLNEKSLIIEVASNDGYLLQHAKVMNIPCLGVEPTASTAKAAREKGIETLELFFGTETSTKLKKEGRQADLTAANNVLAHVPDIKDFVAGYKIILKPNGVATFEFPHLMQLVANNQFDTIYHEHFSYLSLLSVKAIFEDAGLRVFDVEEISTHGGSLRVYACHADSAHKTENSVEQIIQKEISAGMNKLDYYLHFQEKIEKVCDDFMQFLKQAKFEGKKVAAYGAAAKGNTLMNYCNIDGSLISFVCDLSPHKQGLYMPGSKIPIMSPDKLKEEKPDYIVILPWNLRQEISKQLSYMKDLGSKFVVAIPKLEVF
jgi:SAM-dependent methyltransferase